MAVAVVTGAARGLGLAIATALHGAGYEVLVTDLDDAAAAAAAAPIGGWSARLDVRYDQACQALAQRAAERTGGLALWVNNAGVLATGPSWTHSAGVRRRLLDVNALGAMNGTLAALDVMRPTGRGHVINVISLAGLAAAPGEVNYSASKHAAMAFTTGVLLDLRRAGIDGVEVSALCPDGIWTPMLEDRLDDADAALSFSGKLLRPEEVAREVGRLSERPRPIVVVPRWRNPMVRFFDALPRLSLRMLPLLMWDARRRQRSYKRKIESGKWP
jgi:NAD(P)-dependent dehydrogenase (short-subunit alcohol dehydrogenase family)